MRHIATRISEQQKKISHLDQHVAEFCGSTSSFSKKIKKTHDYQSYMHQQTKDWNKDTQQVFLDRPQTNM